MQITDLAVERHGGYLTLRRGRTSTRFSSETPALGDKALPADLKRTAGREIWEEMDPLLLLLAAPRRKSNKSASNHFLSANNIVRQEFHP